MRSDRQDAHRHAMTKQPSMWVERILPPALAGLFLLLGWLMVWTRILSLQDAVLKAYQQTELEMARSMARSINFYAYQQLLVRGQGHLARVEQEMVDQFVSPVQVLDSGTAWLYTSSYVVYDPAAAAVSNYRLKNMAQVFDQLSRQGVEHYQEMVLAVMDGREGVGWYRNPSGKVISAWTTARFESHIWIVGVSTPLDEILNFTGVARSIQTSLARMGLATLVAIAFVVAWQYRVYNLRQMRRALRERESRYNALFDLANDAILILEQGRLLDCNCQALRLFGCTCQELAAQTDWEFLQRPLLPHDSPHQADQGHQEGPQFFERPVYRPDGSCFESEISLNELEMDGRSLTIAMIRDITGRKQAAYELLNLKEFNESIIQQMMEGIMVEDQGGFLTFVNPSAAAALGYTVAEMVGMHWTQLVSPGQTWQVQVANEQRRRGEVNRYEIDLQRKDGSFLPVLIGACPRFEEDRYIGTLTVFTDLTEYRQMEQERERLLVNLEHRHTQLQTSTEISTAASTILSPDLLMQRAVNLIQERFGFYYVGMFLVDEESRYAVLRAATGQAGRMMIERGHRLVVGGESMIGQCVLHAQARIALDVGQEAVRFDNPLLPETRSEMALPLISRRQVIGALTVQSSEPAAFSQDDIAILQIMAEQLAVSLQNARLFEAAQTEIAERKRAEEERATLQSRLSRAERMESLGVLAGGVAHELNNILGPLVGYPDLILMDLPPDSPICDDILRIKQSAERAAAVVQDLLTLARRGAYRMSPLNLNQVVQEFVNSPFFLQLRARYRQTRVEMVQSPQLLNVKGSAPHLSKVVSNLVTNAFEAMPHGGRLRIETDCVSLDRPLEGYQRIETGDYVVLRVVDSGIGIDEKNIGRLFEPFYTKKEMGRSGTGLGLSVVYGVVQDHHGYIDLRTASGQGTEFAIYLPVTREAQDDLNPGRTDYGGHETVLVVDDLPEQRDLAARLLGTLGYRVHTAENGRAAVRHLMSNRADIVVLDMIMEDDFDGLDTLRAILQTHPGQKAVLSSGFSETERVKEAQSLGVGQFVKKPYTLASLGQAIRSELDNKEV